MSNKNESNVKKPIEIKKDSVEEGLKKENTTELIAKAIRTVLKRDK